MPLQVCEAEAREASEVTVLEEAVVAFALDAGLLALAGSDGPELGGVHRHVRADPATSLAEAAVVVGVVRSSGAWRAGAVAVRLGDGHLLEDFG